MRTKPRFDANDTCNAEPVTEESGHLEGHAVHAHAGMRVCRAQGLALPRKVQLVTELHIKGVACWPLWMGPDGDRHRVSQNFCQGSSVAQCALRLSPSPQTRRWPRKRGCYTCICLRDACIGGGKGFGEVGGRGGKIRHLTFEACAVGSRVGKRTQIAFKAVPLLKACCWGCRKHARSTRRRNTSK